MLGSRLLTGLACEGREEDPQPAHKNRMSEQRETLYVAPSLSAALDALAEYGSAATPLAGGTLVMRSPIRHEPFKAHYVAHTKVPELQTISNNAATLEIGPAVTHAELAVALADAPDLEVLATAAGQSANPAIRAMATIGGNLATSAFAAADCVPALLCVDAKVEISAKGGLPSKRSYAAGRPGRRRRCSRGRLCPSSLPCTAFMSVIVTLHVGNRGLKTFDRSI
jgi:xanthine dehydrogenase iron-sulfur cluster and FAD-binding subunit A